MKRDLSIETKQLRRLFKEVRGRRRCRTGECPAAAPQNHTHKIRGPENLKSEPMCVPTTLDPDQLVT